MKNLFTKITTIAMTFVMVLSVVGVVSTDSASAAVATGTDVATAGSWTSYSIYTQEDHKAGESSEEACWYHSLVETGEELKDQYYVDSAVTDEQLKVLNEAIKAENKSSGKTNPTVTKHGDTWGVQDAYKCFGENAKITSQTSNSFVMNVVSTGWSATWGPSGEKDANGNMIYKAMTSNPWGVDATKVINVERGRVYNISFKIKSTLANELMETKSRDDGTGYNVGTGKYNYIKHIHFKAYDDKDPDGAALELQNIKATIGGQSVLVQGDEDGVNKVFDSFVKLDSKNTADDGWVTVTASVQIPADKTDYQSKQKQATMGFKFAFGALLAEFPDENDMSGTIEVKDFSMKAAQTALKAGKIKKATPGKKSFTLKLGRVKKAQKYEIQYATKKNMEKAVTKTTKKKKVTVKKLQSKTKYWVRVRGFQKVGGIKVYGAYSKKVKIKTK